MFPGPKDLERLEKESEHATAEEVEAFIHLCSRHIADLRELQRLAHVILERKQREEYDKQVAARPADFPAPQSIKGA